MRTVSVADFSLQFFNGRLFLFDRDKPIVKIKDMNGSRLLDVEFEVYGEPVVLKRLEAVFKGFQTELKESSFDVSSNTLFGWFAASTLNIVRGMIYLLLQVSSVSGNINTVRDLTPDGMYGGVSLIGQSVFTSYTDVPSEKLNKPITFVIYQANISPDKEEAATIFANTVASHLSDLPAYSFETLGFCVFEGGYGCNYEFDDIINFLLRGRDVFNSK